MPDGPAVEGDRPPPRAAFVSVRGVSKHYGSGSDAIVALDDISLDVASGEVVVLLGPSGCGKSTLLKVVGGLYEASEGTIDIGGEMVAGPSPHAGYMFQTPVLFPWLTVLENALLPIRVRRGKTKHFEEVARGHLRMVGLADFTDRYPWQLSGGMQQRAAICRMLMTDPAILLMDEPFGALDELTREHMDVEIRSIIRQAGKSAVFVTHSIPEAVFVADRVVVMSARPGRIVGEIAVDLGEDRASPLFESSELLQYVRQVRRLLEQSGGMGAP